MNHPSRHSAAVWSERFTANDADLNWLTRFDQRVRNHDVATLHIYVEDLAEGPDPVHGIDGGVYTSYIHDHPFDDLYRTIVDYPGWVDDLGFPRADVADWARGDAILAAWVQDRTDPSPLPLKPAPSYEPIRLDREEAILAHLLAQPTDLAEMAWLPPDTFTADLRHLYFSTMRSLHEGGQTITADTVAAGVEAALSQLSPWYRTEVEDTSAPQAYLQRIALTPANPAQAFAVAEHLLLTDTRLSLTPEASTYVDRAGYWVQPRPIHRALQAGPVIAAVTVPDGQRVWSTPLSPDDSPGANVQPPF